MTKCPRCEQSIDPTTTTICPICGTDIKAMNAQVAHDLNAQPQAQSPDIGGSPGSQHANPTINVRRNLAGDEIPNAQAEAPPSYVIGSAPGSQKPSVAPPAAPNNTPRPPATPQRAPVSVHRAEQPAKSSTGGIVLIAVLIVVAAIGGFWFKLHNRPSPKESAERYYTAIISKDYTTAYGLIRLAAEDKTKLGNADDLKKMFQTKIDLLGGLTIEDIIKAQNAKLGKIGEPKIDGDTATVPVELEGTAQGKAGTRSVELPLEWESGGWKVAGVKGVNASLGGK